MNPAATAKRYYADRTVLTASVTAAFDEIDLSYGMLASLVVSPEHRKRRALSALRRFHLQRRRHGSHGARDEPKSRSAPLPAQIKTAKMSTRFCRKNSSPVPASFPMISPCAAPGETCLVPMIARTDGGQIELLSAAVFSEDKLCGQIPAELLPYAQLLSGQRRRTADRLRRPGARQRLGARAFCPATARF